MTARQTRGERNCNPGNIREGYKDTTAWLGERATDDDPAFEEFRDAEHGIRALAKILLSYQRKHGLRTVRAIINRWAPPVENDTGAYVHHVAAALGVDPEDDIDLESNATMFRVVYAIIKHENGRVVYADDVIEDGIDRAYA